MNILTIQSCKYNLKFRFEAGTSRGVMKTRDSWFIIINDDNGVTGIGECAPLPGLSPDSSDDFDSILLNVCRKIQREYSENENLDKAMSLTGNNLPSIKMGIETALLDYQNKGKRLIFNNGFYRGSQKIPINGLIWMGDREFMKKQIRQKLSEGYSCIKMKIGALDFETEFELLKQIRKTYSPENLVLRVDANGAFSPKDVMKILDKLSVLGIHSIEQPIKPDFINELSDISKNSPVPIALDESLIGHSNNKSPLLDHIAPSYIVLKPTLLGGFAETADWIRVAESKKIGWWITSALESNIGLNAICQFTAQYPVNIEQGLGTGKLYKNNLPSPIHAEAGFIYYSQKEKWDLTPLPSYPVNKQQGL